METSVSEYYSKDGRGTLAILDKTGDTKIVWDSSQTDEVDNARESFNRLRKKGYLAYKVVEDGKKGEQIHEFDSKLKMIILSPPLAGG